MPRRVRLALKASGGPINYWKFKRSDRIKSPPLYLKKLYCRARNCQIIHRAFCHDWELISVEFPPLNHSAHVIDLHLSQNIDRRHFECLALFQWLRTTCDNSPLWNMSRLISYNGSLSSNPHAQGKKFRARFALSGREEVLSISYEFTIYVIVWRSLGV